MSSRKSHPDGLQAMTGGGPPDDDDKTRPGGDEDVTPPVVTAVPGPPTTSTERRGTTREIKPTQQQAPGDEFLQMDNTSYVGTVIADRYRVLREIGRGGMGT